MAHFPIFIDIEKHKCLVVGGGIVALRKVEKLREYGAWVTVVAPEILSEISEMEGVTCRIGTFEEADLTDSVLVIAATDNSAENHRIAEICRSHNILINAVDQMEDCSFIFSSMVRKGDVVAAVSSSGKSPMLTQYLKAAIGEFLTDYVGEVNDLLGEWRPRVKEALPTEAMRKKAFRAMFDLCMEKGELPSEEELAAVLASFAPIG